MTPQEFLQKKINDVRSLYQKDSEQDKKLRLLLYGAKGVGKTSTACTGRYPIYLQSFDPDGTNLSRLEPLLKSGNLIVDNRWEKFKLEETTVFSKWFQEMQELESNKFFDSIGTFVLDGISLLSEFLMTQIVMIDVPLGKNEKKVIGIQHYNPFQAKLLHTMKCFVGLPCDVIMVGHIDKNIDPVSGRVTTELNLMGSKTSGKISVVFPEMWCLRKAQDGKVEMLTQPDPPYDACTRMGDGKLAKIEEPNIQNCLKKAGWDITPKQLNLSGGETK